MTDTDRTPEENAALPAEMRKFLEWQAIEMESGRYTHRLLGELVLRIGAELADQIDRVNALEARMESLSEVNGAHAESLDTLENKVMQNEIDICRVGDSVTEMRIRGSVGF